jgi:uncharacterized protein (DUF885 family)
MHSLATRSVEWPTALLIVAAMAACSPTKSGSESVTPQAIAETSAALNAYLDAEYEKFVQMSPETLTSQGRKEQYDRLDDRSDAAADKQLAWRRESVARMKERFDPAKLNDEARTSYDVWIYNLGQDEKRQQFRRYPYVASELGGDHTDLPQFLITQHRVDDRADMEAYISRVGLIATALDQDLVGAKAAADLGIRMPRFAYKKAAAEAQAVIMGAPFNRGADSALFADGKAKIAALVKNQKITADQAKTLTDELAAALTEKLQPGYERFIAWLKADESHTAPEATGAGALPNGAAYYNAALSWQTTTDMTADAIHELGLSEVKRIQAEMQAVKDKAGFKGTLPEFFQFMRTSRQFYFPNTDAGRQEYLKRAEEDLAAVKAKLPQYFGRLPKGELVVRRVEAFREVAGGAPHYEWGAPDGSRPGIFYIHLKDMNQEPTYQLANFAYHEGLPGHHMQITIAQELTGLPLFRTRSGYNAYAEGWGLYAEALAKEMGFDSDPYDDFGRLSGEIWRAIRLVLDTGIHSKGWTEEQAVKYFMDNSPQPEGAIRSEVRRYFTSPGQATSYKIGMITLQRLRDKARAELGDKFSYPAFHDVVLGGGALPLPVLEQRVNRWLEASRSKPT